MVGAFLRYLCAVLALASAGCGGSILPSHVHDPGRAERASKLAALIDAYGEITPSIYETMLQSSRAIAAEQDKVAAQLGRSRAVAVSAYLPFKTVHSLNEDIEDTKHRLGRVQAQLQKAVNDYLTERKLATEQITSAKRAIEEVGKAVAAAQQNLTNWNASIAILEAGIAEVPGLVGSDDNSQKGLEELKQKLAKVGEKEVEYVDASGNKVRHKIRDIIQDRVEAAAKGDESALRIPDAPGATLTILMLGLDLARLEKEKAEARLLQLARRLDLYERIQAEVALAEELLNKTEFAVQDDTEGKTPFQRRVAFFILQAREGQAEAARVIPNESEDARHLRMNGALQIADRSLLSLADYLLRLRKFAVAQTVIRRADLSLDRNTKRLNHEESILEAQVNDRVWRTVLRAGVVTLNEYEQGGFKPEDAANIIRIAQTVALGIIAASVE